MMSHARGTVSLNPSFFRARFKHARVNGDGRPVCNRRAAMSEVGGTPAVHEPGSTAHMKKPLTLLRQGLNKKPGSVLLSHE